MSIHNLRTRQSAAVPVSLEVSREQRKEAMKRVSFHYYNVDGGGVITVALAMMGNGCFLHGVSFCAPHDTFVKRTGRLLAIRRLCSCKLGTSVKDDKYDVADKLVIICPKPQWAVGKRCQRRSLPK